MSRKSNPIRAVADNSTGWNPPDFQPGSGSLRQALPEHGWRDAMRAICDRHGLSPDALAPEATGSDVVFGTATHVIKLTAPKWIDEIRAEHDLLQHVEGRLSVATPCVVGAGTLSGWPYVAMTRVEGEPLSRVWPELENPERVRLARALGELAAELHALTPLPDDSRWPEFLDARRRNAVAHHRACGAPEAMTGALESFLSGVEPLAPRDSVLLHTELLDEHVLVTQTDGAWRPSAMIDFADGRVGHPFYEFGALVEFVFKGEPGCLPACLEAYGIPTDALDETLSAELFAWYLLHLFSNLERLVQVAGDPRPDSLDAVRRRLFDLRGRGSEATNS